MVISHLTSASLPSRKALIIDVSGNFSVQLLSNIIRSRILATLEASTPKSNRNHDPSELDEKVIKCLQMVDIDTVFDITGLWEVVGSIGGRVEESETEIVLVDNLGILINSLLSSNKSEGKLVSKIYEIEAC